MVFRRKWDDGCTEDVGHRQFVAEGVQVCSPWEGLRGQMWLGGEAFLTRMQGLVKEGKIADIPK